jgi:hypothetical protein
VHGFLLMMFEKISVFIQLETWNKEVEKPEIVLNQMSLTLVLHVTEDCKGMQLDNYQLDYHFLIGNIIWHSRWGSTLDL